MLYFFVKFFQNVLRTLFDMERNNKVLYYDCTNYYFEIEEEDGLKQYGKSKEDRPNPIVQMGLFMDGNGIPLAFDITSGSTNEQVTLQSLENKIIKDEVRKTKKNHFANEKVKESSKTAVIMGHSELRFMREITKLMEFSEMKCSF